MKLDVNDERRRYEFKVVRVWVSKGTKEDLTHALGTSFFLHGKMGGWG